MRNPKIALALLVCIPIAACNNHELRECNLSGDILIGVPHMLQKGEVDKVIERILPLAQKGDPSAQDFVASLFWQRKPQEAVKWAEQAKNNGCIGGVILLAIANREGHGIEKNSEEAFRLYLLAAETGNVAAAGIVSAMYLEGEGVEANEEKSLYWLHKSRGN